ncbi:CheR family methyltransferase [Gluconobacter wancherniae]|uniref:CheR family methyltransferase n=1 Tax=Gluconobacter wancherniae TaxID=1307955 RepID=UPI001B8D3E38|nr:protein-glutamate O-methyltransferase CheR [Gluconobacter wancherniae]MBS1094460.1 protein-glutamate O-methyltransferase CheR [Gluconobacter wancherniae]
MQQQLIESGRFSLSDANYRKIISIIRENNCNFILGNRKKLVQSRLSKMVAKAGMNSFDEYVSYALSSSGVEERQKIISELTTNVTNFFREAHHFNYLSSYLDRNAECIKFSTKKLRIWSAACSSGEESYSIGFVIEKHKAKFQSIDAKILGTDISQNMLNVAIRGVYPMQDSIRIPRQDFREFCIVAGHEFSVSQKIKNLIRFKNLNLLDPWPFSQIFDIIFCRNVSIYFDNKSKIFLWKKISSHLCVGGELYIGHSERIISPEKIGLVQFGITSYRKIS